MQLSPRTLRSEAFAEDLLPEEPPPGPMADATVRWVSRLAPLGVVLLSVAFALVPPLS